jgi:flavin-dependent dehydrogenase
MSLDVAIVGGGPAGAIVAYLLARAGRAVTVFERSPAWRWRACGVFSSPATVTALRRLEVPEAVLARVARPVTEMRVETRSGVTFGLTYGGSGRLADSAVGFDRSALDPWLLDRAREAGAIVEAGATVSRVVLGGGSRRPAHLTIGAGPHAGVTVEADVVVGADGLDSVVARAAGVARRSPLGARLALSFHVVDSESGGRDAARMVLIDDGYVGLAPVPGGRVNVGIVLGRTWSEPVRSRSARAVAHEVVAALPPRGAALDARVLDRIAGVSPLGRSVTRRAGAGWLLVGDAAGFLDPFTGEGLHRAIVSAELAARTILAGAPAARGGDFAAYERGMRTAFGTKDVVTRIVQAFVGRPGLFEYAARRLAARPAPRETIGSVIGDLLPPARALDPRFLIDLLRP